MHTPSDKLSSAARACDTTYRCFPEEVVLMVVDKFINQLDVQLAEKKVTIDLTLDARK